MGLVWYFWYRSSSDPSDPTIGIVLSDFPHQPGGTGCTDVSVPKDRPVTTNDPGTSTTVSQPLNKGKSVQQGECSLQGESSQVSDQVSDNEAQILFAHSLGNRGRLGGEWASTVIRQSVNLTDHTDHDDHGENTTDDEIRISRKAIGTLLRNVVFDVVSSSANP